ncbi:uncharacterized protein LOC116197141 [Punica granatum]|uniref:DUF1005 domain-containing protein n=2 Tax=Punica granatum TaxID=22663 RepID=A0A218X1P8_PUNGR|nr:uncharacterized protein LOC116197141 [Punica granatum]OWM79125.1 hypothetical protein CDL15_Pgr003296 [Punica granatum]PKI49226.1 hypothetical protein CRG98_030375 [Punica granatum]
MDPCPFARILVGNLALRLPNRLSSSSSNSSFTCDVKLAARSSSYPTQTSTIPLVISESSVAPDTSSTPKSLAACFNLNKSQIDKLLQEKQPKNNPSLEISIYRARRHGSAGSGGVCGLLGGRGGGNGKFLGKVTVPVPVPIPELMEYLRRGEPRGVVIHNGWVKMGAAVQSEEVFVTVRVESDPRFVFEFEKEPECSPQVFQVQGNVKQPVFTCKFSCRNSATDRNLRSISSLEPSTSRSWLSSLGSGEKDQQAKERKGWSITIHDLSGSPVAAASMVTPFVPSPGTDRVSRSNPGAWLILRPGHNTWKPWGRLEAWREKAGSDALSYRFELVSDTAASPSTATPVAAGSTIGIKNGGKFVIDTTVNLSPVASPSSSIDFGSGNWSGSGSTDFGSGIGSPWPSFLPGGFVMSSTMQGVDKASRPEVEVGVQHVTCTEDAAAFVALAAAMDLSMDACRLFSQKLRRELRQPSQESVL